MAELDTGMTTGATRPRPISPHLQIYRPMLTMVMSIVHRITGAALYFGMLLLAWWLIAAATGPNAYANVEWFMGSLIGQLILVEIRNGRPPLQEKVGSSRSRVRHRKGGILADLPFDCRVPLLHIWHFVARRAHGKNALSVEVTGGCVSPQRLGETVGKRISHCGKGTTGSRS